MMARLMCVTRTKASPLAGTTGDYLNAIHLSLPNVYLFGMAIMNYKRRTPARELLTVKAVVFAPVREAR